MSQSKGSAGATPQLILGELAWSFSEPIPPSLEAFTDAVSAYARSIGENVNGEELALVFPKQGLDVHFSVWSRPTGIGEWTETKTVVPLRFQGWPTYAAILFELHRAVYPLLHEDDKRFFEGLELMSGEGENGVPNYYLALGS